MTKSSMLALCILGVLFATVESCFIFLGSISLRSSLSISDITINSSSEGAGLAMGAAALREVTTLNGTELSGDIESTL